MYKFVKLLLILFISIYALSLVSCSCEPIELSKTWIMPHKPMEVKWNVPGKVKQGAWIGIVPSDTPAGEGNHDNPDLEFKYLEGKSSGTFTFKAPAQQGKFDVRMYDADTGGKELASVSFTVSNSLEP